MKKIERFLKKFVPPVISEPLKQRRKRKREARYDGIPDRPYYDGVFSPWLGYGDFGPLVDKVRQFSLVSRDRCWILYCLARQALNVPGDYYEAGVYRGGTALLFRELLLPMKGKKQLRLFDTFAGMPDTDPERDMHRRGDFADTSLEAVKKRVGNEAWIHYHQGVVPQTFAGREDDRIAFAHIDLDIYPGILAACEFIYPRLAAGGFLVFDDYGFMSCPGARQAVDEFFSDKPEIPLSLPTGQAIVVKL